MKLYHFRDAKYGLKSIKEKRLKIARIMQLNDPFEFLGVNLKDRDLRCAINNTKRQLSENHGIICFSRNWDNPVQWSHYSDHHRGLCLEFEVDTSLVSKVSYSNHRVEAEGEIDHAFMKKILTTKFSHWAYEQEYRAFLKLDHEEEGGLYFKDFDERLKLTGVIVGHSSEVKREDVSEALGALCGEVQFFKARAAFTKFQIVRNMNENLWT